MNTKKQPKKRKTGGSPVRGNANFMDEEFIPLENKLKNGFPVSADKITNYRDMIKSVCAQALYKGIKNYMPNLDFQFDLFFDCLFANEKNKEIKEFYSCFYDFFSGNKPTPYKAKTAHYKETDKKIISKALNDIEVIREKHLKVVFEKLLSEMRYYNINSGDVFDAIKKLKICIDALTDICEINRFLFLKIIPKTISEKKYNDLTKLGCDMKKFYSNNGNNVFMRINNKTPYIYLGNEGALYFAKQNFKKHFSD